MQTGIQVDKAILLGGACKNTKAIMSYIFSLCVPEQRRRLDKYSGSDAFPSYNLGPDHSSLAGGSPRLSGQHEGHLLLAQINSSAYRRDGVKDRFDGGALHVWLDGIPPTCTSQRFSTSG